MSDEDRLPTPSCFAQNLHQPQPSIAGAGSRPSCRASAPPLRLRPQCAAVCAGAAIAAATARDEWASRTPPTARPQRRQQHWHGRGMAAPAAAAGEGAFGSSSSASGGGASGGSSAAEVSPPVDVSGIWAKDESRSDLAAYERSLDLLGLSGLQRLTAKLIDGLEILQVGKALAGRCRGAPVLLAPARWGPPTLPSRRPRTPCAGCRSLAASRAPLPAALDPSPPPRRCAAGPRDALGELRHRGALLQGDREVPAGRAHAATAQGPAPGAAARRGAAGGGRRAH
jgi:hypothetical protein